MRNRPLNLAGALWLGALILVPALAQARFVVVDANFDGRAAGTSLQRRGALFGEPVPGPFDRERETIISQGAGDMAVELFDTQILGPSEMYWALRDDLEVSGGRLTARIEITPQAIGDYTFALRAPDQLTDIVAVDIVDGGSSNRMIWRDADSPGTFFQFAVGGTAYELMFEVDLPAATWSLWVDGSAVVTDEPHGLPGEAIASLVVGHLDDGNATGVFEYDLVELDWRPDNTPAFLLEADFSDMPAGDPLQARGAAFGEPAYISLGAAPYVDFGLPNGTKAMVLEDQVTGTPYVAFEFLGDAEPDVDPVSIGFAVAFDILEDYEISLREQGGNTRNFADIRFSQAGQIFIDDVGGTVLVPFNYAAVTRIIVEIAVEPSLDVYSVWIDGERIVHRRSHGITDRDIGRIILSCGSDIAFDGVLRADRFRVQTLGDVVSAVASTPRAAAQLVGAVPNPFNPATEVRFELARPGRVQLDIFDSRGRHVRRLVDGDLAAGAHASRWQGRDRSGRPLASGVYHARLVVDGVASARSLTLLK